MEMFGLKELRRLPALARIILGIVIGVLTGVLAIGILDSYSPYQPPPGANYTTGVPLYQKWVQTLPDPAYMLALISLLYAALVGGFIARKLSPPSSYPPEIIAGFAILFYEIVKFLAFPNPAWMSWSGVVGSMLFALLGGLIARLTGRGGHL
jgi:hypothetical protein